MGRGLINKCVFVLLQVQKSSRQSVVEGSDKIKAFISTEVSVHKLFTGWRDLQYTTADLAKDPLPLHLIIYSSYLPLYFHLHTFHLRPL